MSDTALPPDRPTLGLWLRVGSIAAFAVMGLCVKLTADAFPVGQIVFYRSAFALIPLILFMWAQGAFPEQLATSRPLGHVLRCLAGCAAMFTAFASLKYLSLADYTLIGFLTPLVTAILAFTLLGETLGWRGWGGILIGFVGVLLLVWPDLAGHTDQQGYLTGVAFGIATAFLTAIAKIQIRTLSRTEHAGTIALYFALACTFAGALTAITGWKTPDLSDLALLIGAGIFGGIAHILMTLAIQLCPLTRQAGLDYLALFFAAIIDVVVLALYPTLWSLGASVLILFAAWITFQDSKPRT